ncbi:hypothetical protein AJ78_07024 [Emergomyces pasteurianus Ep9510]|uniref:Uncharacterized protein n=1 Tax=Emergomyces pasteurianus Ep9510 TaxID=1447872 RepID=A0A1J9Q8V4_9EURO|nr:hypothetical protein AJ78_07024 [Emergomyces pasteurianus Ep9510]
MNPFTFSFNFRRQRTFYTREKEPFGPRDCPNTPRTPTANIPMSRRETSEQGMFRPPAILDEFFPAEVEHDAKIEPEASDVEDREVADLISANESLHNIVQRSCQLPDKQTHVRRDFLQRRRPGECHEIQVKSDNSHCSSRQDRTEINEADAAESWLRLRLQAHEDSKSRTICLTDLPLDRGVSKGGKFRNHCQVKQASHANKRLGQSVSKLETTRKALDGYLAEDPQHKRALEERELCQIYKNKIDRSEALTPREIGRLRVIKRNVSSRERSRELKMQSNLDVRRKNRLLNVLAASEADTELATSCAQSGNVTLGSHSHFQSSTWSEPTTGPSHSTTISEKTMAGGKHPLGYSKNGLPEILSSPDKHCLGVIGNGGGEDDVGEHAGSGEGEEEEEEEEEESSEEEENEEEMGECGQGKHFWRYSVYQSTECDFQGEDKPKCLGTCLSRAKAEAQIRKQILRLQIAASIQERKRIECRVILEDNGLQAQVVSFASGRTVTVYLEKELVEAAEVTKVAQQNLSILPCRVYSVVEQVIDPLNSDVPIGSPVWGECFVLRQHANAQANRRLLSYVTAHSENDLTYTHVAGGTLEVDQRRYLQDLENGERLFDRRISLHSGSIGNAHKKQVVVRVVEQLLRGPRN